MGGSNSKAAEVVNLPPAATSGRDVYEVKGADHNIVVIQPGSEDDNLSAKQRYRPASKEALAFRDATNVNADKIISPNQQDKPNKVVVKDSRDYIIEHEGLVIGEEKKAQLSKQWWFALSSEPLQRGLDAGLVLGAITAGSLIGFKKQYRSQPMKVAFLSVCSFCVGCMSVPLGVIYIDSRNASKVRQRDTEKMQAQRDEYHARRPPTM